MRQIGILEFDEPYTKEERKILHVDMDAFYASIEQRDHPELRNKPVIIARHPKETSGKGVVATASYEARRYGVHSAMSAQEAYELCPQGIFVRGRHDYYRQVSNEVRAIFKRYTDKIEPLSIDEAFLDVTANKKGIPSALYVAQDIQRTIAQELHLTCSIGVSYNKFIAKLASDYHKPHGITVIPPDQALAFIDRLPVEDIYGIGKRSSEKLHQLGITTGRELRTLSQEDCLKYFGKTGIAIYERVRGVDNRPVKTTRVRKSVGNETTLYPYVYDEAQISETLRQLSRQVAEHVTKRHLHGQVVTLKFRYSNFQTSTRQLSLKQAIQSYEDIYFYAQRLWDNYGDAMQGVRLLGVTLSHFEQGQYSPIPLPLTYERHQPTTHTEGRGRDGDQT
ncbi:MAG: DNA polymerase IV [Aerococcus sp.]|nr:DNA polymerase IV [Aerococcus sp.]